jgi:hypothetical protein
VTDVELRVERLVLDGLPPLGPGDAAVLRAAVEAELTRLLADGGLDPAVSSGGAHAVLRGPAVRVSASTRPGELGTRIARAVHGGLGGSGRPVPP